MGARNTGAIPSTFAIFWVEYQCVGATVQFGVAFIAGGILCRVFYRVMSRWTQIPDPLVLPVPGEKLPVRRP